MKAFLVKYAAFSLICLLLGVFFWKLPLQTQDGPNHKKVAVYLSQLEIKPALQQVYSGPRSFLQTNQLFPLLYKKLAAVISISTYERMFVGVSLFFLLLAYRYFLHVWSPQSEALWILMLPLVFHALFVTGMYNFLASVPLTLLALAILRRGLETGRWYCVVLFVVTCSIAFLAHPFPFFVLTMVLPLMWFFEFRQRLLQVSVYALVVLFFLFVGFLAPLFDPVRGGSATYLFKPPWELLAGLTFYNFVAYSPASFLLFLPFLLALLALMLVSLKKVSWPFKSYWLLMFLGYFLFPSESGAGAHINERFLPFTWAFLPLGLQLSLRQLRIFQGLCLVTAVALGGVVYGGMRQIEAETKQAQVVLSVLPDGARLYPINFDPKGPALSYSSLLHLWAHYDDNKVIYSPYLFAYDDLMPLVRRRPATATYFPATAEDLPEQMQNGVQEEGYGAILQPAGYYNYWFVYHPPEDFVERLKAIDGLKRVQEVDDVSLWHYERARPFEPDLP